MGPDPYDFPPVVPEELPVGPGEPSIFPDGVPVFQLEPGEILQPQSFFDPSGSPFVVFSLDIDQLPNDTGQPIEFMCYGNPDDFIQQCSAASVDLPLEHFIFLIS